MKKIFSVFLITIVFLSLPACSAEKSNLAREDDFIFIPTYIYNGQSSETTTVDFSVFAFVKKNIDISTANTQIITDLPICKYDILKTTNQDKQQDIITINITVDSSGVEGIYELEEIKIILGGKEKIYFFGKLILDKRFTGKKLFDIELNNRPIDLNTQYAQTADKSAYPYDMILSSDVSLKKIYCTSDSGNDIHAEIANSTVLGTIPIQNNYLVSEISAIAQIEKNGEIEYIFLPVVYCGLLNSIDDATYQNLLEYKQS